MMMFHRPKIQRLPSVMSKFALVFSLFTCHLSWASQEAIVMAKRAVVYSDAQMSAPVGFIRQGKKITIGEVARNKAQVYPIIVSGKLAFIKVSDVSTTKENWDSNRLIGNRFIRKDKIEVKSRYALSYFNYSSQISTSQSNGIKDKDPVSWNGYSFKSEFLFREKWGIQGLFNFLFSEDNEEQFRAIELGLGASYLFFERKKLSARLEYHLMGVPFSSYAFADDFRVNGYGLSTGGAINLNYQFSKNWAAEAWGGLYYTQLQGFNPPNPYKAITPVFWGSRLGIGANYRF